MKLFIDSSNNLKTVIKLDDDEFIKTYQSPREQDVLGAIMGVLEDKDKTVGDIKAIEVVVGPGSFTGLRVGVSIANALGYALGVSVNGGKLGETVIAEYGKDPNITKPKKD